MELRWKCFTLPTGNAYLCCCKPSTWPALGRQFLVQSCT